MTDIQPQIDAKWFLSLTQCRPRAQTGVAKTGRNKSKNAMLMENQTDYACDKWEGTNGDMSTQGNVNIGKST